MDGAELVVLGSWDVVVHFVGCVLNSIHDLVNHVFTLREERPGEIKYRGGENKMYSPPLLYRTIIIYYFIIIVR